MSTSTSLGVKLGVDAASMDADLAKAKGKLDKFGKDVSKATDAARKPLKGAVGGGVSGGGDGGLLGGLKAGISEQLGIGGITGIAGAATAAVAAIAMLGKAAVDMAGNLMDASDNMDIGVEKLQGLQTYFEQGGVSAEKFGAAMGSLAAKVQSARDGNEDARASLEKLGIGFNDLFALSPDEMLDRIAEASKNSSDKVTLLADLTEVLGKAAKKMIGPLSQGADEIQRVGDSTVKMSEANAKALDSLGDSASGLWTSTKAGVGNMLGWMVDATKNTMEVLKTGKDAAEWMARQKPEATPAQKAQMQAEDAIQRQKEADAKSDRAMAEAAEKNLRKMREESEKAETDRHKRGMDAEDEMTKRKEDAADKAMSRTEQEADALKKIAHMKEQMVGQDKAGQQMLQNEIAKTEAAEVSKIKARLMMRPQERREADRAERRDQAAQRKAERILQGREREREAKEKREAKLGERKIQPKQAAPAAPAGKDPADVMKDASNTFKDSVDSLRKLKVVAITNA